MTVTEDATWRAQAACQGMPPNLFFPEVDEYTTDEEYAELIRKLAVAYDVCAGCPVREECAEFARANRYEGVYGGQLWRLNTGGNHYAIRTPRHRRQPVFGESRKGPKHDELLLDVLEVTTVEGRWVSAAELMRLTGLSHGATNHTLWRLRQQHAVKVQRSLHGRYITGYQAVL